MKAPQSSLFLAETQKSESESWLTLFPGLRFAGVGGQNLGATSVDDRVSWSCPQPCSAIMR